MSDIGTHGLRRRTLDQAVPDQLSTLDTDLQRRDPDWAAFGALDGLIAAPWLADTPPGGSASGNTGFDGHLASGGDGAADLDGNAARVPNMAAPLGSGSAPGDGPALVVRSGAVLEIKGPLSPDVTVSFGAGYGTLRLDAPGSFASTITGFTGTAPTPGYSDVIDLTGVGSLGNANLSFAPDSGELTVTNDAGVVVADLHLTGEYTSASFVAVSDGQGGTAIYDPTLNSTVLENQLAGTPESVWAINGNINNAGNDNAIEGFATSISIDPGQTENFKILSGSTQYRIDIYRLGYYGGDGARLVSTQTVNLSKAQAQPTPLFNAATNTVDAGNWSVSASWAVPANATSGVYFAKLTTLNGTIGQNAIPFIVTNGGTASDITFQTNDSTWEAYNPWGGYNLYGGPSSTTADRATAVSYNRPIDMNATVNEAGPQDFVFGAEFSSIYWLEENGYNVGYITSSDAANNPNALAHTKVYMDSGHDEYWSTSQYNNVLAAANAGVGLDFLSGNNVYWDIAYTNGLAGTANTTIVEYKDPWAGSQIDPNGTAAGGSSTFRDPVNGPGLPENSLVGNIFQVDGSNTLGNITVPYSMSQFQFWANTSVAALAPGGSVTLSNLLGYEWNIDSNNGFRPAGVVDLSSTTANVGTLLLDYGLATGAGEATQSLTLYRDTTSGALIFGAGTVFWTWGLNTQHTTYQGQTAPVSPVVEQSLVNLLADQGVQPQTLMSSLVYASQSTDRTPPTSKITSIGSGGPLSSNQTVTISGTAVDNGTGKVAMVEISTDGGATWDRAIGSNTWTYSWIVPAAGTYKVETRATNDSAYLETPSDVTTVSVAAGSTDSLFTGSPGDVIKNSTSADNLNSGDPSPAELGVEFVSSQGGSISGVRFWKGTSDTGSHIGSLWTATGTLLASGSFVNETASGWQTLLFSSPVSITAGTKYVAAYHTQGGYTVDSNYFTAPVSTGPLSTTVSAGQAGPGLFAYNASSVFPNTGSDLDNYWVDAIFAPSSVNQPPVANNDSGFSDTKNTALTIAGSALLANDTDPNGLALSIVSVGGATNGTVAFSAASNNVVFTPTSGYTGPASFSYTVTDSTGLTATATVSLTVAAPGALSLWTTSTLPATLSDSDAGAVELGMKFTVSQTGVITGLRYYKGANDTGTHVGTLWSSSGTLLASATFTNETASGWQTVSFATAVSVVSGTTYVAAYHSNGHYADTANYFGAAYVNGPITALASGSSGNGVYAYSSSSVFPNSSYNATNYWVDVQFQPGTLAPPVANADSGLTAVKNTPVAIAAATLLANDTDPNGLALSVTGVSAPANGTVAFDAATNTVSFTPTAGYTGAAGFSYAIADSAGGTASANVSLTVSAPQPPVANPDTGLSATKDTPLTIAAASLLANDTDPNGLALAISGTSGASNGTVAFNAATNAVTFTPASGYTGPAGFSYTVTDATGLTGSASVGLTVAAPTAVSLWTTSAVPATLAANDPNPVELGVKFTAGSSGTITGLRYYKSANDPGTHVGSLWTASGTLLASATFTNETASGWQTVSFSSPVSISGSTTYVAAYHSNGNYADTANYFGAAYTNGPLTALSNGSGGNGVYGYSSSSVFPTSSYNATNYWVDVLYQPVQTLPPAAKSDSGFVAIQNAPLAIEAASLLANDTDPNGSALSISGVSAASNGSVSLNTATNIVTFTPTAGYTGAAGFTYTVTDAAGGSASAAVSMTVASAAALTSSTLFSASSVPSTVTVNDPGGVELGVKITPTTAGVITGMQFYKGPQNTGIHTAELWNSSGALLAQATFTNETASGWQSVTFATPVAIAAGETDIASYHTNTGFYSADANYFAAARTSGPLTAPSSTGSGGNGVYAYASSSVFPTNSYNASNYWVDVTMRS